MLLFSCFFYYEKTHTLNISSVESDAGTLLVVLSLSPCCDWTFSSCVCWESGRASLESCSFPVCLFNVSSSGRQFNWSVLTTASWFSVFGHDKGIWFSSVTVELCFVSLCMRTPVPAKLWRPLAAGGPELGLEAFRATVGDCPPVTSVSSLSALPECVDFTLAGDDGACVSFEKRSFSTVRETLWMLSTVCRCARGELSCIPSPSGGEKECEVVRHFLAVSATLLKNLKRPPKCPFVSEGLGGGGGGGGCGGAQSLSLSISTEP